MITILNTRHGKLVLNFLIIADASLPNPIRIGVPPLDYSPWFNCANSNCETDGLFMPSLTNELSHILGVNFVYTPFTRNFTARSFYQRLFFDLADNEYDVAWGWLAPGNDPYNFPGLSTDMTMTTSYFVGHYWSLIKKTKVDISFFRFLEPFHFDLWFAIVGCIFIVSIAMVFIQMVDPRDGTTAECLDKPWYQRASPRLCLNAVYHSWAALLGGEDYEWLTPAARMLRIALLFLVLITGATYTANLAAFFTKPSFKLTGPQNLDDLKDASVCVTYSTNLESMRPFAENVIAPPDSMPNNLDPRVAWCREQIENGNADALLEPDATAQGILLQNCNNLARGKDIEIVPQQYTFFLRADNRELLAALTKAITQFAATPAYQNSLETAFSIGRSCAEEVIDDDAPEINFEKMRGFFMIFGILVLLSIVLALLRAFAGHALGMMKKDEDDVATDMEMLVNLSSKVDQILNHMSLTVPSRPRAELSASDKQWVGKADVVVPLS